MPLKGHASVIHDVTGTGSAADAWEPILCRAFRLLWRAVKAIGQNTQNQCWADRRQRPARGGARGGFLIQSVLKLCRNRRPYGAVIPTAVGGRTLSWLWTGRKPPRSFSHYKTTRTDMPKYDVVLEMEATDLLRCTVSVRAANETMARQLALADTNPPWEFVHEVSRGDVKITEVVQKIHQKIQGKGD